MKIPASRRMGAADTEERIARILDRHSGEVAPFLAMAHDVQDAFGFIPERAIELVGARLGIPPTELFGTLSFYHYFRLNEYEEPLGVCAGPVCSRRGGEDLVSALRAAGRAAEPISCPGRCDEPIPVLQGHRVCANVGPRSFERLADSPSPLPVRTGLPEALFRHLREGCAGLSEYRKRGGYGRAIERARSNPAMVIGDLLEGGLEGRGGAGFPAGRKWEMVRAERTGEKYVVCNADEGEPGCFKDRALLDHDPHAVIEGMLLAGLVTGATAGIVYLRYEYPETLRILARAIGEAEAAGILDGRFRVSIRRGAGAYICGEETALLNSLEGAKPYPRERPPYPTQRGLFGKPTLVHNVETLAAAAHIVREGPAWFKSLGVGGNAGTRIFSVSGDIRLPGNYEMPVGMSLGELLVKYAGGAPDGRSLKGIAIGGISGGFLGGKDLDVNLDPASVGAAGGSLGAGGIIVYDDSRCMVRAAETCMRFFAVESCGKCFPCRIGTERLAGILAGRRGGADELRDIGRVMRASSACGLGTSAPNVTDSLLKYWPEEVEAHLQGHCAVGECG